MPEISLPHEIIYGTERDVEVAIVAKSLLANEVLIKESAKILEGIIDGITVNVTRVRVGEITNGSPLKELMWVGVFFAFQDQLEQEVPKLFTEITGVSVSTEYTALLTVTVMLVAISIIDQASKKFFPGRDTKALKKDYQEKLQVLAELCDKDPAEIDSLVNESLGNNLKNRLIATALDFFSPSKTEGSAPIYGTGGHNISGEAVAEVPSDLDYLIEEAQEIYEVKDVVVDIHRADRDSNKAGWRAIINAVGNEKVRMELSPEINPASVYGKTTIRADVIVVQEKQPNGQYIIKMYHVMQIINDDQPKQ